ncbi:MAG: SCO family protein [Polyangiales bacterium]
MRSLIAALVFSSLVGCHGNAAAPKPDPAVAATITEPAHGVLPANDVVLGRSIYALENALVDQDGHTAKLDRFRGHPVIISMFYTSCPHACPTLISNVKAIEAKLDEKTRADVRVLLVSFDPEHDKPEALRVVVARQHRDAARWNLTVASDEDAREIAAVLGIKYRSDDGSFRHSSVITVLDREGRIALRSDGLGDDQAAAVAKLQSLATP